MSLSSALSIAGSGLRATSVQSDLVSRNIANATTEGYTRKNAELVTRSGGVEVKAVSRDVDNLLDRLDRTNISTIARAETVSSGLTTYTNLIGQPTDEISPAAGISKLYSSLLTLSSSPSNNAAQMGVLSAAKSAVEQLNTLSSTVSELEREVELNIRYDVSDLNDSLTRIGQINNRLLQTGGTSVEGAELKDELGRLLDGIAGIMDIQITQLTDGAVSVYTSGGTELVTGRHVATVTYEAGTNVLKAGDTEITPQKSTVRGFSGGSLAGLFELKSSHIPELQEGLDEYAGLLISGFSSADPTAGAGEAGLFIDASTDGLPTTQIGLAARIRVNTDADPTRGGSLDKLMTGFGTATALETGSSDFARSMIAAIDDRSTVSGKFGANLSLTDFANTMVVSHQKLRVESENQAEAARITGSTISASRQNLQGVNVDDELQKLLVIEQSYAANAKVLTSVQNMLDSLLAAV